MIRSINRTLGVATGIGILSHQSRKKDTVAEEPRVPKLTGQLDNQPVGICNPMASTLLAKEGPWAQPPLLWVPQMTSVDDHNKMERTSKYDPVSSDREAFKRAKATNRVSEYWETRQGDYQKNVGQRFSLPGMSAPPNAQGWTCRPSLLGLHLYFLRVLCACLVSVLPSVTWFGTIGYHRSDIANVSRTCVTFPHSIKEWRTFLQLDRTAPVHRVKRYPLSRHKGPLTPPNRTIMHSDIDTRNHFVTDSI
eukprot:1149802-Pelagomonas_calceolata.AAC.5